MNPKIQLFNELYIQLESQGYKVYGYLPDATAPYPFVHLQQQNSSDVINNKDVIFGNLTQHIHVWAYAKNRGEFEDIMWNVEQTCRQLRTLDNYYVSFLGLDDNSIIDNTTQDYLLHGSITAEFKIY